MQNSFYSVLIFIFGAAIAVGANDVQQRDGILGNATESGNRSGKFVSLFSVVRFANNMCTVSNGYNGTCLTSAECSAAGGTGSGSCASGFGVCCIFIYTTCGQSSNRNCSYWQNPGGASTTYNQINQCTFNVKKCSSDICQVRLDFYSFTLNQPDLDGVCSVDMFTVTSGVSNSVPVICGDNGGQHMYLDVSSTSDNILLSMVTTTTNMSRSWNIKATQISCSDYQNIAPNDCLQYFKESSGTIQSFNYKSVALPTAPASITRQLANQDYAICIRTNAGSCGICYTACPDNFNTYSAAFSVSAPQTSTSANFLGLDFVCTPDWLQIPCAIGQRKKTVTDIPGNFPTCASKICGGFFAADISYTAPAPVYSYRRPFQLYYYTDSIEATSPTRDANNLGFCLNYSQLPCTTTQA